MSRITIRKPDGLVYILSLGIKFEDMKMEAMTTRLLMLQVLDRLAEYEDLGFAPEEIKQMLRDQVNDGFESKNVPVIANGKPVGVVNRRDRRGFFECVLWDRLIDVHRLYENNEVSAVYINCEKCKTEAYGDYLKTVEHLKNYSEGGKNG